jgi:hypothetical protein
MNKHNEKLLIDLMERLSKNIEQKIDRKENEINETKIIISGIPFKIPISKIEKFLLKGTKILLETEINLKRRELQ